MTLTTPVRACKDCPAWLWALLPLLLAAALSIPLLGTDAFTGDEPRTLIAAGILASGPHTLAGVVDAIAEKSSEQPLGWPLLIFIWGRIAGWSEPAIRLLPLLGGLLAIAVVARAGRDLFTSAAGVFAALLLSGSAFFLTYMSHARSFTMVAFCAALCAWCYWRISLGPRPPGRMAQTGLLLGATGLLYMHYVGSLLLPALCLFHLLFVPKNRRWWRPVLLLGLAGLAATPQLPIFLLGYGKTVSDEILNSRALATAELLERFLQQLSNGAIRPALALNNLLAILLSLALVIVTVLVLRARRKSGAVWLLVFTAVVNLLLLIAINEVVGVVVDNRIRYLMPLWPLTAWLVGAGLDRLAGKYRRLVLILLALWLVSGTWLNLATGYRYEISFIRRSDMHTAFKFVGEHVAKTDGLIMDHDVDYLNRHYLYLERLDVPYVLYTRHRDDPLKHVLRLHAEYPYLWLLFLTQDHARLKALGDVLGRVPCERALDDEWGLTLVRYARSPVHCPDSPAYLQFDSDIQLTGPEIQLEDGMLRLFVGLRSVDDTLLANYSLAIHMIDTNSGERVAQGDVGVGPGNFVPVSSEIEVGSLPPGEYEVQIALYDWQTGARLPARDLETGVVGDMHALQRFRIE